MKDPEILKKFQQKDKTSPVIFTGDRCVVTILQKFEKYNCLSIQDKVITIGIFDMEVDGKETGLFLAGRIEMHPSETSVISIDNTSYVQLVFKKGDVFIQSTDIVLEWKLGYYVWLEYIKFGHTLKVMSYEDQACIFDRMCKTTGLKFPVDHAVYETIFAHLSRDANDFTVPYRNTKMNQDFRRIQLNDVAHAAKSTASRIIGAWMKEGINAALDNPNDTPSQIEDLLRK